MPDDVTVGLVTVSVAITHPARSDLTIDVVAPSGVGTTIYDGSDTGIPAERNLIETLPATPALRGQNAQGTWQLRVGDTQAGDTGTLQAWELTITPMSATPADSEDENVLFSDTFQDGLAAWTPSAAFSSEPGWAARPFDETGNIVAQTWKCPVVCNLATTESFDLSAYESATLSFDRWVDRRVAGGKQGLSVLIGHNGTYQPLDRWTRGDDTWHRETYTLSADELSDAVTIRFTAIPSPPSSGQQTRLAVDNVVLTAQRTTPRPNLTIPSVSVAPTHPQSNTTATLRLTVRNSGSASARSQPVRFYRHTARTATPSVGGTRLAQTTTSGSLAAGASVSRSVTFSVPFVTSDTRFFYYACVDPATNEQQTEDNCSGAAEVTVRKEETTISNTGTGGGVVDPRWPFGCYTDTTVKGAPMGGDMYHNQPLKRNILGKHFLLMPLLSSTRRKQLAVR